MGVTLVDSVADVCRRADFITIHLPKTPETVGISGEKELAEVPPGARIVNTARGGLIDEAALANAVKVGRIAGAALDVFDDEPISEHPLFGLPNVVVTPTWARRRRRRRTRPVWRSPSRCCLPCAGSSFPTPSTST